MKRRQSSLTAEGIAIVRAMESDRPPDRRICYDPYARQLINPFLAAIVKLFAKLGYAERRGPGVWEFLTARERCIDDYLQSCLENGVQQVVILGAGLDSRAYRFEAFQHGVKVFEVDHPATQKSKMAKVQKVMGTIPSYVTFVPVDFETETLAECLEASGYDRAAKTLFIWQGVVHYLTPEAVDSMLAYIAHNSGQGSSVIFDYVYQSVIDGTVKRGEATAMRRNRRLSGEAMQFGIPQATVREFLEARGFDQVRDVTAADMQALYFTGANAGRSVAPVYAIVSATVKASGQAV